MNKFNAFWETCTPDWVAKHGACGSTVRRPILEHCDIKDDPEEGHWHQIGHEHLMAMPGFSLLGVPVDHKSGEPA